MLSRMRFSLHAEAVQYYDEALRHGLEASQASVLACNKSAAHFQLDQPYDALAAARKAVEVWLPDR